MRTYLQACLCLLTLLLGVSSLNAQVFSEDFESGLGTFSNDAANGSDWVINTSFFQEGVQSAHNQYLDDENNILFVTNSLDLTGLTNPQLSFWHIAKTEGGWDEAFVEISTDGGATFQEFQAAEYIGDAILEGSSSFDEDSYPEWGTTDVPVQNAWWKREFFDLSNYMTDDVVVRFRLDSDLSIQRDGWYIDNVEIYEVTCVMPSLLVAENVTSSEADLSWTPGDAETEWEIVYGEAGFNPDSEGTTISDNDGVLGENITSLNPATDYHFYVKAVCAGGEESELAGPFTFTTECTVFALPWSEDFASNSIPNCWSQGGDNAWDFSTGADYAATDVLDHTPGGGTNYAWLDGSDNSNDDVSTLTSPLVDVSSLTAAAVEFYLFSNNTNDDAVNIIDVEINTDNGWENVLNISQTLGENWSQYVIDISGYTITSATQVRFTVTGDDSGGFTFYNDILIDDVTFLEMPDCVNPIVNYAVVQDCLNGPQFLVDVEITNLGGTDDLEISDDQGSAVVTADATGTYSFGPYTNGTEVLITVENTSDANCSSASQILTQEFCTIEEVDCTDGPVNLNYCYEDNEDFEITYVSSDGSSLNLNINSGFLETCCDDFIVLDTDGTELFNDGGDISGQSFQSTGDEITILIDSDGSVNCGGNGYDPIDLTVSCATCTNPQVEYELISDCLNAPQFFVDVDVIDLGSATDLDITDNQGNPAETVSAPGIVQFGPYANGAEVEFTVENNQDSNCELTSGTFVQEECTENLVDCTGTPVNTVFCYNSGEVEEFTYISNDGTNLNLSVNSGQVENNFDEFIVLDSDGTELYNGYGNAGDLSGLNFQSSGDEITVQVTPDGSISCQQSGYTPIDLTVSCATCTNPQVEYVVVDNCTDDDTGFFVDVTVQDLGSLSEIEIVSNQGDAPVSVTSPTTETFGPYDLGTSVEFTIDNDEDTNCVLTSQSYTLQSCGCNGPVPFCAPDAGQALVFQNVSDESDTEADPNLSDYGCLGTQPNPVWYYMQVEESGELVFQIEQATGFDEDTGELTGTFLDVDFIAWGPFTDTEYCDSLDSCSNCGSNTFDDGYPYGNVVDCSYDAQSSETFTIPNAQEGEIYAVLITNFNGAPGFISLGQTNSDDNDAGSTDCDIVTNTDIEICEGEEAILESEAPDPNQQHQWFVFNETTQEFEPIMGANTSTYIATDEGLYQVQYIENNVDVVLEEFTVVFIPAPEVNLPDSASICEGETLDVDATVLNPEEFDLIEYQWLFDGNEIIGETNPIFTLDQAGIYTLEVTTTIGTPGDEDAQVCVQTFEIDTQQGNFTVDLGGDQDICGNGDYEIIAEVTDVDPDADISYLWGEGEDTASITVDETGIYQVTVTVNGCSITESVDITFIENPEFDLGGDQSLCDATDAVIQPQFTIGNPADATFEWSTSEITETITVTESGVYELTVTIDGCSTTESVEYTFNESPVVDLGGDVELCDTEDAEITANITSGDSTNATYEWSTGEDTQSITVSETNIYTVTITTEAGCSTVESVEYIFNESPIIDLGEDIVSCDLNGITLDATPSNFDPNNTLYEWYLNGELLPGENLEDLNTEPFGFGNYEVIAYSDSQDCSATSSVNITERDDIAVNLEINPDRTQFCEGESIDFTASLVNASPDEVDFVWFVNGSVESAETAQNFEAYEFEGETVTIAVEASINGACVQTASVELNGYENNQGCVITQGISPNGDGFNDNLDLAYLDDRTGIASLEIFNRYGRSVFKQNNYRDEFFGQNESGDELTTGTYFYVIKLEDNDPVFGIEKKGWIYINKEK
ncbi:T9SS type B sorting domain-containing protein [Psychroflexus aestuariivivens]|uniref:T9SS type B sorting domain-containing protein n=1 Tax=Psychroflexus aestuariivivens TaxID=1795040 RepID=UPI000FDCCB46|nr:gliding motility-associated C-terminal domain-containing protein [Psychroflexus aestuariivivens]